MTVTHRQAARLTHAFVRKRVLVVGDLMLDRYIVGSVQRISPEAPVPVVHVDTERAVPGGAANVAWNLAALGGRVAMAGMIGNDQHGHELKRLLSTRRIATGSVLESRRHRTTVKTRIIAERQQLVRVDWEDRFDFSRSVETRFCQSLEREVALADGVVIADYGKGMVTQFVVDCALRAARASGIPISLDPKNFGLKLDGITFVTPNRKEAFGAAGLPESAPARDPLRDKPLLAAANILMGKWRPRQLLITLGSQGMLLCYPDREPRHVPTRAREVFDVSGAGDTVIATCTLAMAAGASFDRAAELANYAAGIVVGKLGTATCTPAELLEYLPG